MNSDTNLLIHSYFCMAKTAAQSSGKWAQNSSNASQSYVEGVSQTPKDQAALAIAAKGNWKAGLDAAVASDSYAKGLQRSGKSGWQAGVHEKGAQNYGTGVSAAASKSKYESNSGRYDSARGAASSITRGPKGSPGNLQRVAAVASAERLVKTGK